MAQRGGRIIRITCWQDNRGEGGGEFSVLRESFMIESVWNPRRTLVAHCRERRCRTLEVQRRTLLDIFSPPRRKHHSDVPAELKMSGPRPIGADRSRLRACPGDSAVELRALGIDPHARHNEHLADVVPPIRKPSESIDRHRYYENPTGSVSSEV